MRKIYLAGLAVLLAACQNTQNTTSVDQPTLNDTVQVGASAASIEKADTIKADTAADTLSALVTPNLGKTLVKKEQVLKGQPASEQTNSFTVSKRFSGSNNDTLTLGSAQLCVPAEGMKAGMKLSITPLDSATLPSVPAGLANVTTNGGGYRFLPHGEHFKRFAKVVIPFDSLRIPKGYTAKDIRTYYYDEQVKKWTVLPKDSILKDQQLASALTTHFTDMINGIITVPETPEAQGYAPTTLSDIKAADPSAGKMAVEAPKPNNNGTANIQIPFNFPKGRAGMGPNFSVGYSNEGGSSWCGYGWGVNTPSISIETRWGVPRYDTEMETESYLFNGEQFTDRAYRDETMTRKKDKRFYLRRETDFSEIVRKGNAPTNYTWEVKHMDGTIDYYEGIEKDDKGNIAKWGLKKTTDAHGNCVTYEYGSSNGTAYISSINYTGFNSEAGVYSIKVNRKGDREDPTSNGRNGFLQKDDQLLTSIDVLFKEEIIRSYKFEYTTGKFGKTLLAAVAETDAEGTELYRNGFKYYDDIGEGGLFEDEGTDVSAVTILDRSFEDYGIEYSSRLSLMSGAESSGKTIGGGVNVSYGFANASIYGGASYTHSSSSSEAYVTLNDINGDGLVDRLFKIGDDLFFEPNLYSEKGYVSFGSPIQLIANNVKSFTSNSSKSNSVGLDVGIGYGPASFGCSYSYDKDKSETRVYLQDFNGDGLVDVANNGTVYFNRLIDGIPTFTSTSQGTPNPIIGTSVDAILDLGDNNEDSIRKSLENESPLHDIVRCWRAPLTGKVRVNAPIKLTQESPDGIVFSLQHGEKLLITDSLKLRDISYPLVDTIDVQSNDYLYFRTQSIYSGKNDEVFWAPEITYLSFEDDSLFANPIDENGLDLRKYSSEADFVQGKNNMIGLTKNGTLNISGVYSKDSLTEDLTYILYKISKSYDTTIVDSFKLKANDVYKVKEYTFSANITDTVMYSMTLQSKGMVDWNKVDFSVKAVITTDSTKSVNVLSPSHNQYNKLIRQVVPAVFMLSEDTLTYLNDSVFILNDFEEGNLTIKSQNSFIENTINGDTIFFLKDDLVGNKLHATLYYNEEKNNSNVDSIKFHRTLVKTEMKIDTIVDEYTKQVRFDTTYVTYTQDTIVFSTPVSVYSAFDTSGFGIQYRGWGQFAYNGSGEYKDQKIDVNVLKVDNNASEYENLNPDDYANIANKNSYIKQRFYPMSADSTGFIFYGSTNSAYLTATTQCPSRLGEEEIVVIIPEYPTGGDGACAPILKTQTETHSWNLNGGGKAKHFKIGLDYSKSYARTLTERSAIDMNGDRYPDVAERNDHKCKIQFSSNKGNLTSDKKDLDLVMSKQYAEKFSIGASVGASTNGEVTAFTSPKAAFAKKDVKKSEDGGKESEASISASGNFSNGDFYSEVEWMDVNGDGLPDMVDNDGNVKFNIGYDFVAGETLNEKGINKGSSHSFGAGLTESFRLCGKVEIGFGPNFSRNVNETETVLIDVNGDGLPDYCNGDNVILNSGKGFNGGKINWNVDEIEKSVSVSQSSHMNVGYAISYLALTVTPHVNVATSSNISRTERMLTDLNGDGLPDYITCDKNEHTAIVRLNRTGRTNLLQTIVMPGGAKIALKYESTKNSYDMPTSKYVLSGVEVLGGNPENGATRTCDTILYEGGLYDRYEREFLGFSKVITKQLNTEKNDAVYRSSELTYSNKRLIEKGLLLAVSTFGADNEPLSVTNNTYNSVLKNGSEFLALVKTVKESYTDGNAIVVSEDYTYDEIGNVTGYTSTAGDVVNVTVQYNTGSDYLKRIPTKVHVEGGATRDRSCQVNDKGDITKITMENGSMPSVYDFEYDQYGNITKVTRPENEQGQRMWNKYTYDDVMHAMVTEISNAYGYKASTEYDYRFGVPTKTTDINNNDIKYEFDNFGRMTKVVGPYDEDYTIKMVYDGFNATTYNHTLEGDIETITTADNLMRPVRIKKTSVVDGRKGYVVSGVTVLDAFGRVVKEALPALEGQTSTYYTTTEYDNQDRKVKVTLPDGSESKMAYEVENNGLKVTATDAEGHISEQYTDARERTVKTVRKGSPEDVVVEYQFNGLGGLETVTHPNGLKTKYTYDKLGHKLTVDNPDAGLTSYTYDAVGNVVTKTTPNLAKISKGGYIKYVYDYERLSEVQYPKTVANRVQYTYGKAGDDYNRAGRVVLVEDASGGVEHFYGKLGEEVKTIRTVLLNSADIRTYVAESEFDSWNRIRKMTYPDGEVVTYGYDEAGQLNKMSSEKDGFTYDFIKDMTYDVYGNISSKTYGNGTTTNYTYDPKRQHLTQMTAANKDGLFINATYSYDKIDNILGITNTAKPNSTIGGNYHHSYTYDDFSRLVSAEGGCKDNTVTYNLTMTYDAMSNPLRKIQKISGSEVATSHDLTYLYNGEKPDAASQIGEDRYTYDDNGNPTLIVSDSTTRTITWDEENRMVMLNDDGYVSRYTYDFSGTRVIKSHGPQESVYINGAEQGLDYHDADNYTLYVSPYLIVNNERFTKHYYAGTQRIASKVGSGEFYNVYGVNGFHLTAGDKDYKERLEQMEEGIKEYYKTNGIPPGEPTMKGSNADPYVADVALPNVELGDYSVPTNWPTKVKFNEPGDVPGPVIQFEDEDQSDVKAGYGFESDNLYEGDWFFFHTDHLGSTSYLTDTAGNVSQFVCYTPYGEAIVDEHLTTYENPFKFSGKELDDITGLYDHGARSRNPVNTLWYGIDPFFEKYPEMSPYGYCHGNPVLLIDLDGCEDEKSQANANGHQQKQNNPENPKPCPSELIGTPEYYEFRKKDFERRNPGKEAPDYYENYGKKYAERFEKLKPELSEKGKKWVDNTMINLQKAMEEGIVESENGASLERDPEAFKSFAYNTHAEAYKKAGIAGLSISELKKIGLTPDPEDLFTKDGVKQVCEIGLHVSWQWIKDFVRTSSITDPRYTIPKTFTSPIIPY